VVPPCPSLALVGTLGLRSGCNGCIFDGRGRNPLTPNWITAGAASAGPDCPALILKPRLPKPKEPGLETKALL